MGYVFYDGILVTLISHQEYASVCNAILECQLSYPMLIPVLYSILEEIGSEQGRRNSYPLQLLMLSER